MYRSRAQLAIFSQPIPTAAEMQALDALVMEEQGLTSYELMERVGRELTRRFFLLLRGKLSLSSKKSVILVGPGNNGGDGLVLARELHVSRRVPVTVIVVGSERYSKDCEQNILRFQEVGGKLYRFGESTDSLAGKIQPVSPRECENVLSKAGIIVDALLGTGQTGPLRGEILELLTLLSSLPKPKVRDTFFLAIDTPTGVSGETGEVFPSAFKANMTLTVQYQKFGMTQGRAPSVTGEVVSIPANICSSKWRSRYSTTSLAAFSSLPPRTRDVHKGTFGHLLIVAGSEAMPGAAVLVADGALGVGVGKVTTLEFSSTAKFPPEVMRVKALGQAFCEDSLTLLLPRILRGEFQSLVIGPGLGQSDHTCEALVKLLICLEEQQIAYVLDADGLTLLSTSATSLPPLYHGLMTPHPGEAAKLLHNSSEMVQRDRRHAVEDLARQYGGTWLLKGPNTLVWNGSDGKVNLTGSPALATGGSGDVLSGIAGGFLAQLPHDNAPLVAGDLAAYLHGLAGSELGAGPQTASAIAHKVSTIFQNLVAVRSAS